MNLLDNTTERLYASIDITENCGDNNEINAIILREYLDTSMPPHELRLRKYCIIMLIRNLSIDEGLCNGTRLLVLELSRLSQPKYPLKDESGMMKYFNNKFTKLKNNTNSKFQHLQRYNYAFTITTYMSTI